MRIPTVWRRHFEGTGGATAFAVAGVLNQYVFVGVMAVPWLVYVPSSMVDILMAIALPLPFVAVASPVLTAAQRRRFLRMRGVVIPRLPPRERAPEGDGRGEWRRRALGWLRSRATARELRYHLLLGPAVAFCGLLTLLTAITSAAAATIYLWIWILPVHWRLSWHGYSTDAAYVTAAGVAALYGSAWLAGALARLDTRNATALLGPSREEKLARRVVDLTESRAGVVDAADEERRRIERDLHDGAQQRLVSMAVNLGLARATLGDQLSDQARAVIDEAHREAKEAIAELSNLVRGLHPAVLEDRGLDAALSGIAARAPLPVRLSVDLPARPSATIEAVAYFVVSEALANVVKHAQASEAAVTVERFGGTLLVVIADDGVGGADPAAGTGLAGLAKRVASVDGTFSVSSPTAGPTIVTVELPCVL
ncbi:histidine kinase [Streptomyces sp. NPDC050610]|uniref:sensor histidine kinase n=1 Tax=Streptomyces sp. NPDC050610 TaxID=3157097 RepID=UPI003445F58B